MKKKATPLIPPDKTRCQAEVRAGSFMSFGVPSWVRCNNAPSVIATETTAGGDGRRGSMALCDECLKKCIDKMGAGSFTTKPAKAKRRSRP